MKKVQAGALDGLGKMRRWSALTTLIELDSQKVKNTSSIFISLHIKDKWQYGCNNLLRLKYVQSENKNVCTYF